MIEDHIKKLWLGSYDDEVKPHIHYENLPVFAYLDRTAERHPKRTAIVFRNWSVSYKKLRRLTETVAANLQANGLRQGERVAIMLPNLPQTIIAYWAVLKAGGVVVMTNPLYMEKELVHHFSDSGARILITLDMVWPKLKPLLPQFKLRRIFVTSIADSLRAPLNLLYRFQARKEGSVPAVPYDDKHVLRWKKLLKRGPALKRHRINPSRDLALLQYTGGTTGVSKGVMITHSNLGANLQQCLAMLHEIGREKETFLGLLPYFHIYGLTVCLNLGVAVGATLAPFPRFVPQDVLKIIHKVKPTVFPSAPAVFLALLQQKDIDKYDLSSIRYCVSGSAPIPVEAIHKFKDRTGAEIIEGYGLTEASPITHLNPLRRKRKIGSIGLPFPDTDACIVDQEVGTVTLGPGKVGELVIRGPQVMRGYWNLPDETASAIRNSWLYTGDIAYMDEEGYFYIVDRKKDMIISAGYNIYPREIDEVLHEIDGVREAVAVGIPHPTRGEIVKAYIVADPAANLKRGDVIAYCRRKLANYKVPKKVEFRTELPKTLVGKVLRRTLRDEEVQRLENLEDRSSKLEA